MKKRKLRKLLRALGPVDLYAEIEADSVITINGQAIQMKRIELGKVRRLKIASTKRAPSSNPSLV